MKQKGVMYITDVTIEDWCKRYDISTEKPVCQGCKKPLDLVNPFAMKEYRGIEFSPCKHCSRHDNGCRVVH